MATEVSAKVRTPEQVHISVTATFQLCEWEQILEATNGVPYYFALDDLRRAVADVIRKCKSTLKGSSDAK